MKYKAKFILSKQSGSGVNSMQWSVSPKNIVKKMTKYFNHIVITFQPRWNCYKMHNNALVHYQSY